MGRRRIPCEKISFSVNSSVSTDTPPKLRAFFRHFEQCFYGEDLPNLSFLDLRHCSRFELSVIKNLANAKYGEVLSYSKLANASGSNAVRAVASVCAKNRFPLFIPCHRIIRKNGHIGNYIAGVETKRKLLQREGFEIANDYVVDFSSRLPHDLQ